MTATINYDQPVKNLIDALSATGHVTHKAYRKDSVTFHHNAGRLSHEGVLNVWKTRPASAQFNVDGKGTVAQFVKPNEYAWATGNTNGNQRSISIELANSSIGGQWPVATTTWMSGARLAGWLFAKVIGAQPTSANVLFHHHWKNTVCAGPYMNSVYSQLLAEVVKWYNFFKQGNVAVVQPPPPPPPAALKSNTQIAAEVWAGQWGTGSDRVARLKNAGYDPVLIQQLVNKGVGKRGVVDDPNRKSNSQIADEVWAGKWGNGPDRVQRLTRAGYDAAAVQREVNRRR